MKKFLNLFIIVLITLLFDFIITFFFISKFNFYDTIYPKLDHRIANKNFHHSFKENVSTTDYWGSYKYKFYTNSLGFKDISSREVSKQTDSKKRIIIIGDSFTEGIGFKYEDTFVGLLDKKLAKQNIEILNAGVASQSPIIYFKKIKHLIEIKKVKFDEIIVFLDISDIPDEYYYNINFDVNDNKNFKIRDYLQEFFIQNSSIYLFFDLLFSKTGSIKNNMTLKYKASKKFKLNFFKTTKDNIDLYKSLNVERGMWNHDDNLWNLHGLKGRDLADMYLNNLFELCKKNNIKLTLAIYPWPIHIYYDYNPDYHRNFWINWSKKRNIKIIDLFNYFEDTNRENLIKKLFIPGDVHWNKKGHKYIYNIITKEYFKS